MPRIAIVEKEKCNPVGCGGYLCIRVCPINREGEECIGKADDGKAKIDEKLCIGCDICVKKCPFDAISIINLPAQLENPIHRFGRNGFHLYNLPIPIFGKVVGIVGRNGIGIELNDEVIKLAKVNLAKEKNRSKVKTKVIKGDSRKVDLKSELNKLKIDSVQFVLLHPPYWDIIKFSKKLGDLSNAKSVEDFLEMFGKVIDNSCGVLDKGRYLAVVIGDKYSDGEWIPLGFYTMQEVMKRGYKLKSTIVKNFDTTKGKMNQKELWRYRALAGGFYIFKHEYIFLFQKK